MNAGTLVAWHKKAGDVVKRGDIVAEVETDKGVIDVEIFTSGTIERLLIQPGEKVPVGTVLATVREEGSAVVGVPGETPKPPRRSGQQPLRRHRPCVCRPARSAGCASRLRHGSWPESSRSIPRPSRERGLGVPSRARTSSGPRQANP